ncbi:hypothetical protein [Streptomyces sp. CA2R101]
MEQLATGNYAWAAPSGGLFPTLAAAAQRGASPASLVQQIAQAQRHQR